MNALFDAVRRAKKNLAVNKMPGEKKVAREFVVLGRHVFSQVLTGKNSI
jgi:hypothetical protein